MRRTQQLDCEAAAGSAAGVLTCVDDGLHCELVAALLDAAAKRGDVLLLSEFVGVRKHGLDLSHVTLLEAPARWTEERMRGDSSSPDAESACHPFTYLCIMS